MKKIADGMLELIGNTPLVAFSKYSAAKGLNTPILAKMEFLNPGGSVKDRIALAMIEDAERRGVIQPGATLIEPTSGNTGVGLALVSAAKGYHLILTMPETMSLERRNLIKAYGAELVLTPGNEGMNGSIAKAWELHRSIPGSFIPQQFENPSNPEIHKKTTALEIWNDTDGHVDIFVAGVGTGGTLCGVGAFLKEKNPSVQIVAVEPAESPVLSGGKPGLHKIQGIGANFVPANFNRLVVDEILQVSGDESILASREAARYEGALVGFSSGAALSGAVQLAQRKENKGKTIVALLPDNGERYLSTVLFAFENYPL